MPPIRPVLAGVLSVVVVTVGALGVAFGTGFVGVPSAGIQDRGDWTAVSETSLDVTTTIWVNNPTPVGLQAEDVSAEYELSLANVTLATGSVNGLAVPQGNTTTEITTTIRQQRIEAWWVKHVRNGERSRLVADLSARITLGPLTLRPTPTITDTVETNITGLLERSLSGFEGPQPSSTTTAFEVRDVAVRWGSVTDKETSMVVTFTLHNPNSEPVPTPQFVGNLTANDIELVDWQANEVKLRNAPEDGVLAPGETREIDVVADIDNRRIGDWLTTHVRQGEKTKLVVTARLAGEFQERTYTVPQEGGFQCTSTITTAILVDNQTSAATTLDCGVAANVGESGDDTGSAPTGHATAEPSSGTAPLTVEFDATDSTDPDRDIRSYRWRFDDGSPPAEGAIVSHTFHKRGTYEVVLVVTDAGGNSDQTSVTVTVTGGGPSG